MNGIIPKIDDDAIPDCYRQLIEKCWSQDPKERLSFDQIVNNLKTNNEFITPKIKKEDYFKYIEYVEKMQEASIESSINISDFGINPNSVIRRENILSANQENDSQMICNIVSDDKDHLDIIFEVKKTS